jgi:uncharacterized protein YprB with RNaseH-like and TPR domain
MSTVDRLREIVRGTGERRSADYETPRRELTYEPVDKSGLPLEMRRELPAIEGAAFIDTPAGQALAVDRLIDADAWHGQVRVEDAQVHAPDVALLLSTSLSSAPLGQTVFLDLETTGLSGGAGTVAFLVGCGWFEGGAFRTRQFLLPGFGGERAMLAAVATFLADCGAIVTYNGKTFDLPVMETRWLFQRLTPPFDDLPHFDLLHMARRLWARREDGAASFEQAGCRLVSLEHELLGVTRVGDVPGWEIPSRYFDFIRHGNAAVLTPVLYHNQIDLLSLGCLAARAARLLREGPDAATDGAELVALGREYVRRGDDVRSETCFRRALTRDDVMSELRGDALHGLARLLRRRRRHKEATPFWHELAKNASARGALQHEAREALAVHYEHRARDLELASHWAHQAAAAAVGPRRHDDTSRRLARLGRKIDQRQGRQRVQPGLL